MSPELPARPDQSEALFDPRSDHPADEAAAPRVSRHIGQDSEEGPDFRRYLAAVLRYKWLVATFSILGGAAGMAAARLAKPEYSAQATIWIENAAGNRGPIRAAQLLGGLGWADLLKSYVVLDVAVRDLKLYLEHESPGDTAVFESFSLRERFRPGDYRVTIGADGRSVVLATAAGTVLERATPGDSLGGQLGFNWIPSPAQLSPGRTIDFSVLRPRDAARGIGERLRTRAAPKSNFLRVELAGTSPALVTATVNTVVERFVEVAAELKRAKLTELVRILETQLAQAQRNLSEAEIALESYRVATITLPSETPVVAGLQVTQGPVMQGFFELKLERDQIAQDRAGIQRALEQAADSGLAVNAFEGIGAVQRSTEAIAGLRELTEKQAELRALRYDYTDEYPAVQGLVEDMRQLESVSIPTVLQGLLSELAARQSELDGRLQAASRELERIPPRAIREARLRRDVAVAENLYIMLQQRYEEASLSEASSIPDVRILDPAVVPQRPVRNRGPRFIALGFVVGIGLSLGGAVLLDRVDRRVRYADQVTGELGLQLLSVVPHFDGKRSGSSDVAPVVEALRGARLNLIYAHGTAGPLIVTVTSPGAGDGKSFIASNLALAFAEAGYRTLLIDGDVRRGALHRAVAASRKPGLTDFLNGHASRPEIIQETEYRSLFFIGAGTRTAAASELLGSEQMTQLFASLRSVSQMNAIIVDSPPLAAGVDAYTLGTLTGSLLVVLRLGLSDRELAEAKLDVLDRLPVRVLGAILNDAAAGARYYHSYYLQGYEQETEEGEEREARALLGKSLGS